MDDCSGKHDQNMCGHYLQIRHICYNNHLCSASCRTVFSGSSIHSAKPVLSEYFTRLSRTESSELILSFFFIIQLDCVRQSQELFQEMDHVLLSGNSEHPLLLLKSTYCRQKVAYALRTSSLKFNERMTQKIFAAVFTICWRDWRSDAVQVLNQTVMSGCFQDAFVLMVLLQNVMRKENRWQVSSPQSSKKVEMLLNSLGYGTSVQGPGEV